MKVFVAIFLIFFYVNVYCKPTITGKLITICFFKIKLISLSYYFLYIRGGSYYRGIIREQQDRIGRLVEDIRTLFE